MATRRTGQYSRNLTFPARILKRNLKSQRSVLPNNNSYFIAPQVQPNQHGSHLAPLLSYSYTPLRMEPSLHSPEIEDLPAKLNENDRLGGFWALIAVQFQGAFSDNALKWLVSFL